MKNTAFIGLGSNLGEPLRILHQAWETLGMQDQVILDRLSSPYRTEPFGMKSDHWFINAVGSIHTSLEPGELLRCLLDIEKQYGRKREGDRQGYQDRILDFDLLLYNRLIVKNDNLVIPHPEIEKRHFVLVPLCEIAPEYIHPLCNRSIRDLLHELEQDHAAPEVQRVFWNKI